MSLEGLSPLLIEPFGGVETLPAPMDVEVGKATDSKNVLHRPGSVESRAGRSNFLQFDGGPFINSMGEFCLPDGVRRRLLILTSFGELWKENGDQTKTLIETGIGPPDTRLSMQTAFGRQYIATSDGKIGIAPPRYYDDTKLYRVSQSGPGESPNAADGPDVGSVTAGLHFVRVVFEFADGSRSAPGPATRCDSTGDRNMRVSKIPRGPSNVVRRIIVASAAISAEAALTILPDGVRYFFIPDSSMVINDNTTTEVFIDFSDAALTAAEDVTNSLFQIILPEQAGVILFNDRLFWWGGQNEAFRVADNGLLNMHFDGGYTVGVAGQVPNGWTGLKPGCLVESPVEGATGAVFSIVADGVSQRGTIENNVRGMELNTVIRPNTPYGGRLRARKSPGLTAGSVSLYFLEAGSVVVGGAGGLTIDSSQLTTDWQDFAGPMYPALPTAPVDLVLRISGGKGGDGFTTVLAPAGEKIQLDFSNIYPLDQPYTQSLLYGSKPGQPGVYDETGFIQVAKDNGQAIRSAFIIRGNLYVVKESSLFVVSDNGDDPVNWPVQEVSPTYGVGTPSIVGVSGGEGWEVVASRSGLYLFTGGFPDKISEEIQPTWDEIDWEQGHLIVVLLDPEQKQVFIQVPIRSGTAAPAPPPDVDPDVATEPYILTQTLGTLRSDTDIWVGFSFTTGAGLHAVRSLGRWKVAGNALVHAIKLFKYVDGTSDVLVASAVVGLSGGSPGEYIYTAIAPVILEPSTVYYIVSQEAAGGDEWYDFDSTVDSETAEIGSYIGAVTSDGNGGGFSQETTSSQIFVPLNFKVQV